MYYHESEGFLALLKSFLTSLTPQKKRSGLTSGGNDKQKRGRMKPKLGFITSYQDSKTNLLGWEEMKVHEPSWR